METKQYIEPEMEVTLITARDVIRTSGGKNEVVLPDDDWE